jgi:hypothetical protein
MGQELQNEGADKVDKVQRQHQREQDFCAVPLQQYPPVNKEQLKKRASESG